MPRPGFLEHGETTLFEDEGGDGHGGDRHGGLASKVSDRDRERKRMHSVRCDVDGKEYLDMTAGIANLLGHGDPYLAKAVKAQTNNLAEALGYGVHYVTLGSFFLLSRVFSFIIPTSNHIIAVDLAVGLLAVGVASNHIIVVDLAVSPLAVGVASNHIIAVDLAVPPLAVGVASNHIIAVYLSICFATTMAPVYRAKNISKRVQAVSNIMIGTEVYLRSLQKSHNHVAQGYLLSKDPTTKVGGFELGPQCWEIQIDVSIVRNELLLRPYSSYQTIGDAVGATVAWPYTFVKCK
uniref:Transposase Tnp1/En/Spm-like domain-containing protein n=1 Tax=Ananas comosus var. bracteatus TaxID=296719 RepID=A0A6V7QGM6_ANACO|nr:unnamed protein product [Ananas comosus var. bracteatus]